MKVTFPENQQQDLANDGIKVNFFNIRVYGILMNENKQVLVSDELIRGNLFTKFPGGGMEFGEGTKDCLVREFKEETGLDITIGNHIYTTDFFQISAFNQQHQIISIYYYVMADDRSKLKISSQKFDFSTAQIADKSICAESFRWVNWNELNADSVSLPIDKVVVEVIKKSHSS